MGWTLTRPGVSLREKPDQLKRLTAPFLMVGIIGAAITAILQLESLPLFSLAVLVVSLIAIQLLTSLFDLTRPTIGGAWYLGFVLQIFLPGLSIASTHADPGRTLFLNAIHLTLLAVPSGMIFGELLLRTKRSQNEWYRQPTINVPGEGFQTRFYILLLVLGATLVAYMLVAPVIPVLGFLKGTLGYFESVEQRQESFKLLPGIPSYLFALARNLLVPLAAAIAVANYARTRTKVARSQLILILVLGSFFSAASLAKAPFLIFWVTVATSYWLVYRGNVRTSLVLGVAVVAVSFPLAVFAQSSDKPVPFRVAVESLNSRVSLSPASSLYYYFEAFPQKEGFLHGRSIGRLSWLLGKPHFDTAEYVARHIRIKSNYQRSIHESNNAAFIGDFYADFGMAGVVIGGFLTGLLFQSLQSILYRWHKDPVTIAVQAFLCVGAAATLNSTALPGFLLSGGGLICLLLAPMLGGPRTHHGTKSSGEQVQRVAFRSTKT